VEQHQRSSDWFSARWGVITASRYGDVINQTKSGYAASRKNYMSELVIQRLTPPPTEDDGYKNAAMTFGIDNEPVAKLAYELETGNTVDEAFFELLNPDIGASPDGYVGEVGLIEIKCPNTATHIETIKTNEVPKYYIPQIQGQMMVTGRDWCDFVSYDPRLPENAQLFIKRVKRDEAYIKDLLKELNKFITELEKEVNYIKSYKGGQSE
jgi:putative phage-type endonuclease